MEDRYWEDGRKCSTGKGNKGDGGGKEGGEKEKEGQNGNKTSINGNEVKRRLKMY